MRNVNKVCINDKYFFLKTGENVTISMRPFRKANCCWSCKVRTFFFFFCSEGKKLLKQNGGVGLKLSFCFLSLLLLIIITPENTTITATVTTADGQEDSRLLLFLRWYRYQKHYFSIFCWGCCCHCGCCYVPSPAHPLHHSLQVQAMASFSLFFPFCLSYTHHQGPAFKFVCL